MKRTFAIVSAVAALALVLVVGSSPAEAAGTITPWQSEVAVGATFSASANGCPVVEEETDTSFRYQRPELRLLVGSGPSQRLAAFGALAGGVRVRFTLPGWVDPAEPASIVGACTSSTYSEEGTTSEVLFTYSPVAIDIVAGTPEATGPLQAPSRTTAAGGQVIRIEVTGCEGAEVASSVLVVGSDLTLGQAGLELATIEQAELVGGSATIDLALNGLPEGESDAIGPLPEGTYTLVTECISYDTETEDSRFTTSAPLLITVAGTNASGSLAVDVVDDELVVRGEGCTGGRTVTVSVDAETFEGEPVGTDGIEAQRALAHRDLAGFARAIEPERSGEQLVTGDTEVVPEADGTWELRLPITEDDAFARVGASCGDPLADGFSYGRRFVQLVSYVDVYVDRVSPTSSPTGGPVTVQLVGYCEEGDAQALLLDLETDDVVAASEPIAVDELLPRPAELTAPDEPGAYVLATTCGDSRPGEMGTYEVFAPEAIGPGTGPNEPWDGWPETGSRETYDGRLGPIALPPAGDLARKALGPTELFTSVPRPEGDFAITEITFELVYADGTPVDPADGQIGYFVIMDRSHTNPACPGGTFGLPGRLVAAAGNEKTVLQSPGPYGIVVDEDDVWTGTYRLASLADTEQEVFISYQFEIRRDLENVRPITTYFGSTTGCDWFDYTLGGTGGTDVQSHYLTVAKDGRLIGAGGSLTNGGIEVDWTNDRGDRFCSAKATYSDDPVIAPDEQWEPPRFYPDDTAISSISTCPLGELVAKGERLRIDSVYDDSRPRSGATGVYVAYVWEGGGPAAAQPGGASPLPGTPSYTG